MNKHFKYLILLTLGLMVSAGLVHAQVPIGLAVQPVPFESSPTAQANSGTAPSGYTMMWDGDLYSLGSITLGSGLGSTAYFTLQTFKTPVIPEWNPEWVEIKMKYEVPSAGDDKYRIEYSTDGATWEPLQPDIEYGTFTLAIRPWSQLAEPSGDGVWSWSDIADLQVRVYCTKMGLGWDAKKMYIYEVWATVYPAPLPPSSSTTISVQPSAVTRVRPYDYMLGGVQGLCFVEIYVNDVADLFGYMFILYFDTNVLTPTEAFSYYPWTSEAVKRLDDAAGYVSMAYDYAFTVPVGEAFYGGSPVARIYFLVDAYGGGGGGGATCDLIISRDPFETRLSDSKGDLITPMTAYDGWFSGSHYMSLKTGILPPGDPTTTKWHEIYPDYCENWTLTSFNDTDKDGSLSPSDQIDMTNETGWKHYFHVDDVTVTIHWTFKAPASGLGAAEPLEPTDPEYIPVGTYWHQIYPPDQFCRWFVITSEEGNGDGYIQPSEQFDFEYLDEPGVIYWAHLDSVTTDILVSEKPIEPEPPPIPEFPLGLGLTMAIVLAIPIVYLWRTRKKVEKQ